MVFFLGGGGFIIKPHVSKRHKNLKEISKNFQKLHDSQQLILQNVFRYSIRENLSKKF